MCLRYAWVGTVACICIKLIWMICYYNRAKKISFWQHCLIYFPILNSLIHSLTDRDMEMVGGDDDDVGCCSCFQTPTARIDSSTADNTPLTTFPNGRANSVNDRRPTSSTNHGSRIAREPSYEDTGNRDSRRGPRTNPDRSQSVHRPQNVLT